MLATALLGLALLTFGATAPPASATPATTPPLNTVETSDAGAQPGLWWNEPPFGFRRPRVFREGDPDLTLRLAALFHIAHIRSAAAVCTEVEVASETVEGLLDRTRLGPLLDDELRFIESRSLALRERWAGWPADEVCAWAYGHYGPNGALHQGLVRPRPQGADPEVTSALPRR